MNTQQTPDILKRIVQRKFSEVKERKQQTSTAQLQQRAADQTPVRGFAKALANRVSLGQAAVIAEIKRASPSKGVIREHFDPEDIARSYAKAGATCLSVLTDRDFFQGSEAALIAARAATDLPVLRKDFMVDPYQILESRAIGADCVLLIVACLSDSELREFYDSARSLGMDVLIEVHTELELARVQLFSDALIGINNRDLHSFSTSLDTTFQLLPMVPQGSLVVTESGIHSREDVQRMRAGNVHAFLVGEAFMRASDPGSELRKLFS